MFSWNRFAQLLRRQKVGARSLRFESLESRLPAAADFNWPEVAYSHVPEWADAAQIAPAAVAVQPRPVAADSVFAALDACGDFLNATGRAQLFTASDSIIMSAVG